MQSFASWPAKIRMHESWNLIQGVKQPAGRILAVQIPKEQCGGKANQRTTQQWDIGKIDPPNDRALDLVCNINNKNK